MWIDQPAQSCTASLARPGTAKEYAIEYTVSRISAESRLRVDEVDEGIKRKSQEATDLRRRGRFLFEELHHSVHVLHVLPYVLKVYGLFFQFYINLEHGQATHFHRPMMPWGLTSPYFPRILQKYLDVCDGILYRSIGEERANHVFG